MAWLFLGLAAAALAWRAVASEAWQFSRAFLPNQARYFALRVASAAVVGNARHATEWYGAVLAAALVPCAMEGGSEKLLPPVIWTLCLAA